MKKNDILVDEDKNNEKREQEEYLKDKMVLGQMMFRQTRARLTCPLDCEGQWLAVWSDDGMKSCPIV